VDPQSDMFIDDGLDPSGRQERVGSGATDGNGDATITFNPTFRTALDHLSLAL
jgi:hypothetical protein